MIYRWVLIFTCTVGTANVALAFGNGLEGILFNVSSIGSYGQSRQIFGLTDEEFAAFTTLRVESQAELKNVYGPMRDELRNVVDEPTNQAWQTKHSPLIRQINYDLWQRATKILKTQERTAKFHRMALQEYLHGARDIRCIASLLGKELTWKQIQSLKEKIAANPVLVENALAQTRRELEETALAPFLDLETLRKVRGEEFHWKSKPPESDDHGGFFDEEELGQAPDKTLVRVAAHSDVLDKLKANLETRKAIEKLAGQFLEDDGGFPESGFEFLAAAKNPVEQLAIQRELVNQRKEATDKIAQSVRSVFTEKQFERLQQITIQQKLRNFDYVRLVRQLKGEIDHGTRRKIEEAAYKTRHEIDYAKTQLATDFNAKSFDEVLGTTLAKSLGKVINHSGLMSFHRPGDAAGLARMRERYGTEATLELPIPASLTTAPKERIEWNTVEVPDGWKLADAMANLEKSQKAVKQIVEGSQKWDQRRDALRDAMMSAQRNGDRDLAKELRAEFSRDFGGPNMFATRRQFREAYDIAQEDLLQARRIVKKLGGDPGHMQDQRHRLF